MGKGKRLDFRDVSGGLQVLREILLGRKYSLHGRFAPGISPRSVPPPNIPRGPEETTNYSKQYYYMRSAFDSVMPPVIAPVAEGPPLGQNPSSSAQSGGIKADTINFGCAPTPGMVWWWDGHCYYEYEPPKIVPSDPRICPPQEECGVQGPYK